ncbi:sigma-54-dependent transcriptional regulator [Thiohalobacter thiocyanaticus]|uniref:sigma-54-dependent transcriptional regulator n=1 Tax=Thiohalobacter thiocyanaticus TaxID=585455 RepID=UPI001F4EBB02|nr:sigma 54-interacting transcriptional regulator [Thiohalobacter thiocyanaticus]
MDREPRYLLFWNSVRSGIQLPAQLRQAGWRVTPTERLEDARHLLASRRYPVGLACLNPGDTRSCRDFEQLLLDSQATTEWLALVEPDYAESASLCRLLAGGVFDFHTLPLDAARLIDSLGHAAGLAAIRARCRAEELPPGSIPAGMVANSPGMRQLFRQLDKIAQAEAPVLITGESGSGKELTAQAIHQRSRRADGPLVPVNCASLPVNLVQTELFGHEKGAFTGAVRRKTGRIEAAAGGTVFLDEIGDLPLELQTSLLQASCRKARSTGWVAVSRCRLMCASWRQRTRTWSRQ